MLRSTVFALVVHLLVCGCTTGERFTQLRPGMTKTEVISLLGNPKGYTRSGNSETLQYPGGLISGFSWDTADFYVVLKDGKVESYGSTNTQKANRSTVILVH